MPRRSAVHQMVISRKVPKPTGPVPHGVQVEAPGRMLFVSAQLPVQPPAGAVFTGEIRKQAELVFANVRHIVMDAGFTMDDIVQVRIYVTDLKHFERVDDVYRKLFPSQTQPARTHVQVAMLPQGAGITADAVAIKRADAVVAAPAAQPEPDPYGDQEFY